MPKMKTKRGAHKRFKLTASGKIRYRKANRGHILTKKAPKRKRQLRKAGYVDQVDMPRIRRILGV